jgi:tRNA(Leu) C34 or U34 (ribose-2'-O)-methylase TrmL
MLHTVLYQPEIPHNTGAVGRLCLATGGSDFLSFAFIQRDVGDDALRRNVSSQIRWLGGGKPCLE